MYVFLISMLAAHGAWRIPSCLYRGRYELVMHYDCTATAVTKPSYVLLAHDMH